MLAWYACCGPSVCASPTYTRLPVAYVYVCLHALFPFFVQVVSRSQRKRPGGNTSRHSLRLWLQPSQCPNIKRGDHCLEHNESIPQRTCCLSLPPRLTPSNALGRRPVLFLLHLPLDKSGNALADKMPTAGTPLSAGFANGDGWALLGESNLGRDSCLRVCI